VASPFEITDRVEHGVEELRGAPLELRIPVLRLRGLLQGFVGEQERLPIPSLLPGDVGETVEDIRDRHMVPGGTMQLEVPAVVPVRRLEVAALLVHGRRQAPDSGADLLFLRQPVDPGEHLVLMPQRVVGEGGRSPGAGISLIRVDLFAPQGSLLVLLLRVEIEAGLDSALPTPCQDGGQPQSPRPGDSSVHRKMMPRIASRTLRLVHMDVGLDAALAASLAAL
jgi:hypothetical protein